MRFPLEKKSKGFLEISQKGIDEMAKQKEKEQKLETLELNMGDIFFESALDKAKIAEMEAAQADLLMEIAFLKMGGTV